MLSLYIYSINVRHAVYHPSCSGVVVPSGQGVYARPNMGDKFIRQVSKTVIPFIFALYLISWHSSAADQ